MQKQQVRCRACGQQFEGKIGFGRYNAAAAQRLKDAARANGGHADVQMVMGSDELDVRVRLRHQTHAFYSEGVACPGRLERVTRTRRRRDSRGMLPPREGDRPTRRSG